MMKKFSIIVPIYNTEKYLEKCLDSIVNQTYKDFEIILVNDGSTDNSKEIIKKYIKKYDFIKLINEKNQGLSAARNNGIKEVKTPFFLLVDSDDYIEKDLLTKLNEAISSNPDLVRFQIKDIDQTKKEYKETSFENLPGNLAFNKIVKYHYVENAWAYLYKTSYFKENKYAFPINKNHEDFGLIPLVIYKAKSVTSINYIGYNYVKREGSIINSNDYNKTLKKVDDFYSNYLNLRKELNKIDGDKNIINSYLANSLILKITELNYKDYRKYLKKLHEDKVFDLILDDTPARKMKKIMLKISPKLYYRRFQW